ncbi:hypothetical protein AB0M39_08260 [Streptomyces sp. NPDC051907]|uniref:hypothetical protein n=1 Tax=Streptomyces sp. NPDC051907 TaxID=3155284 RepID=UPI003438F69E
MLSIHALDRPGQAAVGFWNRQRVGTFCQIEFLGALCLQAQMPAKRVEDRFGCVVPEEAREDDFVVEAHRRTLQSWTDKSAARMRFVQAECEDAGVVNMREWDRVRCDLRFGQRFQGRVTGVPALGAIGIFVDIGLPVGGFVDVLLLPTAEERWPVEGAAAEFEVWWADERPQVRLKTGGPQVPAR